MALVGGVSFDHFRDAVLTPDVLPQIIYGGGSLLFPSGIGVMGVGILKLISPQTKEE